jgi:ribosomal protein S20
LAADHGFYKQLFVTLPLSSFRSWQKTIGQYAAKGCGDPAGLQNAKTSLQAAEQALKAGDYNKAREGFDAATNYVVTMVKEAAEDLKRRYQG